MARRRAPKRCLVLSLRGPWKLCSVLSPGSSLEGCSVTSEGQGNVCLVLSPSGAAGSVFSCVLRELTGGVFCYVGGPAEWVFSDVLVPKMSVSWDKDPTAGNIASTLSPN